MRDIRKDRGMKATKVLAGLQMEWENVSPQGVNVLFSGVIPRNVIPERHKIFRTALALGAKVQKQLVTSGEDKTTHVVAARLGTEKVLQAQK